MEKKNKYFLYLIIAAITLFVLDCASIIFSVTMTNSFDETQNVDNALALGYLIIHLILVAAAIYYSVKAYVGKSVLIGVLMYDEKGEPIKKSHNVALTLAIIFGVIGVFFLVSFCGAISALNNFPKVLEIALINVGFSVSTVALFFYFYKLPKKEEKSE